MATPWNKKVKDSGKLSVYNGLTGKWSNTFQIALPAFNDLTKASGLKIELVAETNELSANVLMNVGDGVVTFAGQSKTISGSVHGKTIHVSNDNENDQFTLIRAAIFLPGKATEINQTVMTFIALHELVHACGLDTNKDHANDGIFMTLPNIQDNLLFSGDKTRKMPPWFFDPVTITMLQKLW